MTDIDFIRAFRERAGMDPNWSDVAYLLKLAQDGDLIHVDEARAMWRGLAPAVTAE